MLKPLLTCPGVYIEAADAVSWVLRKNNAPIIEEESQIRSMLQLPNSEAIAMNPMYNHESKGAQKYVHLYWNEQGELKHANTETMFGTYGSVTSNGTCSDVARVLQINVSSA